MILQTTKPEGLLATMSCTYPMAKGEIVAYEYEDGHTVYFLDLCGCGDYLCLKIQAGNVIQEFLND